MRRRPGASTQSNLSQDELRVLSRVDFHHPVDVTTGAGVRRGYALSVCKERVRFEQGGDVLEVPMHALGDVTYDHSNDTVRFEGTDISVASHDRATTSAVRRIILALKDNEIAPPRTNTERHHAYPLPAASPAREDAQDWHLHDSPTVPTRSLERQPSPLTYDYNTNTNPSGAVSPLAATGTGPGGGSSMVRKAPRAVSTLTASGAGGGGGGGAAATNGRGYGAPVAPPTAAQPLSLQAAPPQYQRESTAASLGREPSALGITPVQSYGGETNVSVPPVATLASSLAPRSAVTLNAVPSVVAASEETSHTMLPAHRNASSVQPYTAPSGGRSSPPAPLFSGASDPAPLSLKPKPKGKAKGYPPSTASHWVVAGALPPPSKNPFEYFGPLADSGRQGSHTSGVCAGVKVVDLVSEPASEKGKLLMLLGEDVAGNTAVAVYNGHPEVELYIETWVTNEIRAAPGVERSVHPQYQAPVYCIVIHPGDTKEFICGPMKTEPQPGWKTQPLSDTAFAKRRKDREAVVFEDYQRLQQVVDREASEVAVLEEAVRRRVPFVDLWFLPQPSSLVKPFENAAANPNAPHQYADIDAWGRPAVYLPPGQTGQLFISKAQPNDIDMGFFGNAWLPCCLAALAELSDGIEAGAGALFAPSTSAPFSPLHAIFWKHKAEYAEMGAYRVVLSKDGWWREAAIDNYLPLIRYPKRSLLDIPAFAHNITQPREVWASLVEKAYARMCGSYAAISTGYFHEGLMDLSGFPAERIRWNETKDTTLFEDLKRWCDEKNLVVMHTPNPGTSPEDQEKEKTYAQNGLMLGYAYAVLDVSIADGHKLVRIRNPWPSGGTWGGRWAAESKAWTTCPNVTNHVGYTGENDGSVWLAWPEVIDWFAGGAVMHYLRDAGEVRLALPFQPSSPAFVCELQVKTPTRAYIGVHLKDQKGRPTPQPYGCINITILQNTEPYETCQWQRLQEDYEWGSKDFLGVYDFVPEEGSYLICVHDYDGGAEGGKITEDVVLSMHYTPMRDDGPSVEGTLSIKEAAPVIEAIRYNPVFIRDKLQPVEAFAQVRRHISSQHQPTQHQVNTTIQL